MSQLLRRVYLYEKNRLSLIGPPVFYPATQHLKSSVLAFEI